MEQLNKSHGLIDETELTKFFKDLKVAAQENNPEGNKQLLTIFATKVWARKNTALISFNLDRSNEVELTLESQDEKGSPNLKQWWRIESRYSNTVIHENLLFLGLRKVA